jgi:fructose-bisphosphate aldolase class II
MLVSMKEILDHASEHDYAVAAPNVLSELDARAYLEVAEELHAPLILDVAFEGAGVISHPDLYMIGQVLRDLASASRVPVAIHLDHGGEVDEAVVAIQAGFTSVMIDRSTASFDVNVADTQRVVSIAHAVGVSVEAELGHVGDAEHYANDRDAALTSVDDAVRFVELTGVDCLAVAVGTAHGIYPPGFVPYLDFDRLSALKAATGNLPLVMHGSSGTNHEDLRRACAMGINKVNIASDLFRAAADAVLAFDLSGTGAYSLYATAIAGAKTKLAEMIRVYGSDGRARVLSGAGLRTMNLDEPYFKKRSI